ncbi:MAG TPA: hypothetical protein PK867_14535 [Pirellulales bacterium]|nr:hypothetical protein [Pirellulales bacterium]
MSGGSASEPHCIPHAAHRLQEIERYVVAVQGRDGIAQDGVEGLAWTRDHGPPQTPDD